MPVNMQSALLAITALLALTAPATTTAHKHIYSMATHDLITHPHINQLDLSQQNITYLNNVYGSAPVVTTVRSKLLLIGGGNQDITTDLSYAQSRAYIAIPGLVMALIALVTWPFFCICRCCGKCGGRESDFKRTGYTPRQIWMLFGCLLTISLGSAGMGGLGVWSNEQLDQNISGKNGVTGHINNVFVGAGSFITLMSGDLNNIFNVGQSSVNLISTQIQKMAAEVSGAIVPFNTQLNKLSADLIAADSPISVDQNDGYTAYYVDSNNNFVQYNSTISVNCPQCDKMAQTAVTLNNSMHSTLDPVINDLNTITNTIQTTLVDQYGTLAGDLQNAVGSQLNNVQNQLNSYQSDVGTYTGDVDTYEVYRRWAITAVFALPMLSCVLLLISTIGKYRGWFTLNIHVVYLTLVLTWLLFALHLVILRVNADGCEYIDNQQTHVDTLVSGQGGAVLQSCLFNTPVVDALGLTSQLDFSHLITFPPMNTSVGAAIGNLTELTTLSTEVNGLNTSAYGVNNTARTDAVAIINQVTNSGNTPAGSGSTALHDQFTLTTSSSLYVNYLGDSNKGYGYCKYCTSDTLCTKRSSDGKTYTQANPSGPYTDAAYTLWDNQAGNSAAQNSALPPGVAQSSYTNTMDMVCKTSHNACMCKLMAQRVAVMNSIAIEKAGNQSISALQADVAGVESSVLQVEATINDLFTTEYNYLQTLVMPVIAAANKAIGDATCGWLGADYRGLKGNACGYSDNSGNGGSVTAVGWITVSLFVIGICQTAALFCNIILQKRIKHGMGTFDPSIGPDGEYNGFVDENSPQYAMSAEGSPQYYLAPDQSPMSDQMIPPQSVDAYYVAPEQSPSPLAGQPLLGYQAPHFHDDGAASPTSADRESEEQVSPLQYH